VREVIYVETECVTNLEADDDSNAEFIYYDYNYLKKLNLKLQMKARQKTEQKKNNSTKKKIGIWKLSNKIDC